MHTCRTGYSQLGNFHDRIEPATSMSTDCRAHIVILLKDPAIKTMEKYRAHENRRRTSEGHDTLIDDYTRKKTSRHDRRLEN